MATRTRRADALSRARIVEAAVALLDAAGEGGLTFRALTEHLATGPGTIYWHVANKDELLAAAADAVVAAALDVAPGRPARSPRDEIRAVALGLFDAIGAHPWLGAQLAAQMSRSPGQLVTPRIFEALGRQVAALGVPRDGWFTATSVLVAHVLGVAVQNAAAHALGPDADRAAFLDAAATTWEGLDADAYPFTRAVADQLRHHDDREQFLTGLGLILTGIAALPRP